MKYKLNDIVEVLVTGIEPYGVFVLLDDNYTKGLLHISEISNEYVVDIRDYVNDDTKIKVKIIDILANNRVRVSLKALNPTSVRRRRVLQRNPSEGFVIGFSSLEEHLKEWIKRLEEEYEC